MIASAYAGPQQELVPLVRRGDVVRFVPRRGARRYCYVRVTSDWQRQAQFSPRSTLWLHFVGVPVRCYDYGVQLGPERDYAVAVAALHRMPRHPVRFATPDGRLVVDVISLEHSGPWYRVTQRPRGGGGLVLLAEVRTPAEVDQVRWQRARASLADLDELPAERRAA
jgi:hypothetical protein